MSPVLVRKLKLLALICVFMGGVAVLYDLVAGLPDTSVALDTPHEHADTLSGEPLPPHRHVADGGDMPPFAVGVVLGLAFGVLELFALDLELFALERWGRRLGSLAFGPLVVAKAALYTLVVFVASHTMGLIAGYLDGRTWDEFWQSMVSPESWSVIIVTLASYAVLAFFVQISRMVGPDVLMKFIRGRYLRPTQEDRVFMFLDLKGSTAIAEKLGPTYYRLLNDFFHDLSHPVLMARAEIYQYVGDEVVLT